MAPGIEGQHTARRGHQGDGVTGLHGGRRAGELHGERLREAVDVGVKQVRVAQVLGEVESGGDAAAALRAVLQFALGHNLAVDVCLVLEKDAVPPANMTPDNPLRLGGNCWLGAQRRDPDDMRYALLH